MIVLAVEVNSVTNKDDGTGDSTQHGLDHVVLLCLALLGVFASFKQAHAVSARWSFEQAYDNVNDGDWYKGYDNETATLAWGESYVMMSLASMYRATLDPMYLDRLAMHIDGVLTQRDDARGLTDYRGVSGACWRNLHYQPDNQAYCYVVHTGMLTYPMVEYARLVRRDGLEEELAPDGESHGSKASRYITAAQQSVAFHEDQWNQAGYYIFRPDATFLDYAGTDVPLNQSNALGRTLIVLYELTGEESYRQKAEALAVRFREQCTTGADGTLLWNYWGGAYTGSGEDISHAALNVGFAVLAAQQGFGFSAQDMSAMARTFVERVYVDDATFSDRIGGGSTNGSSYRPQVGRWVILSPMRTSIYTAVRDVYERDYAPDSVGSGSILYGWALLAEYEPPLCSHFFYYVDWADQGAFMQATAVNANILTKPPELSAPCMIPLQVHMPRRTTAAQWDGQAYHRVAKWQATGDFVLRRLGYEPSWPHVYWQDGVLFEFEDNFVSSDGIEVMLAQQGKTPVINSDPPTTATIGTIMAYPAMADGDEPLWWSLPAFARGARVDASTGLVTWTPQQTGSFDFMLRVENDWGAYEQEFSIQVSDPGGADAGMDDGTDGGLDAGADPGTDVDAGQDSGVDAGADDIHDAGMDASTDDGEPQADPGSDTDNGTEQTEEVLSSGGCACSSSARQTPALLFFLLALMIRRIR